MERRKTVRNAASGLRSLTLTIRRPDGGVQDVPARLIDYSEGGAGIACAAPLTEGELVAVNGQMGSGEANQRPALVAWCVALPDGSYRAGLSFSNAKARAASPPPEHDELLDFYDCLQLSPKADADTIHRVFRILAQRYHPDNCDTGNEEQFKRVLAAYQVLSNPERRAAYDARRSSNEPARWRIFDTFEQTLGVEAERRKRQGVLAVLYARRAQRPEQANLSLHELESLLGCPKEHLEFSLWYLREIGQLTRTDNGRFAITAEGVEAAEAAGWPASERPRIAAPKSSN